MYAMSLFTGRLVSNQPQKTLPVLASEPHARMLVACLSGASTRRTPDPLKDKLNIIKTMMRSNILIAPESLPPKNTI